MCTATPSAQQDTTSISLYTWVKVGFGPLSHLGAAGGVAVGMLEDRILSDESSRGDCGVI